MAPRVLLLQILANQSERFALMALLGAVWLFAVACNFNCDPGQSPLVGNGPNVFWSYVDSIAACPAGDSVQIADVNHRHPSKLRLQVWYDDNSCSPKAGVPPESLWVTWSTASGNAVINDQGASSTRIFADDTTDACGHTRFTIPSLSGCGKVTVSLYVSGRLQGSKTVVVRTVDVNANGRVDIDDLFQSTCDVAYNGDYGHQYQVESQHEIPAHWHRNALFGTLVKRSQTCETCASGQPNTIGNGEASWAANGKWIGYSQFDAGSYCKVWITPADPRNTKATEFTWPTSPDSMDYDPIWSPFGDAISFDRQDVIIYRKGFPGLSVDTLLHPIVDAAGARLRFATAGCVSPDNRMLAFVGIDSAFDQHIYMVPVSGGVVVQLTSGTAEDLYPKWSPDGQTIVFDRYDTGVHRRGLFQVSPVNNPPQPTAFYYPDSAVGAAILPCYSPDGQIVTAGFGGNGRQAGAPVPVATFDASNGAAPSAVVNYPRYASADIFPKLSPDGTRVVEEALDPDLANAQTRAVWAARRNMSLPPQFTSVGTQSVADSTTSVSMNAKVGLQSTITVSAADPETDPITYSMAYAQAGMSFSPSTMTLTWVPPDSTLGRTYVVKFIATTPSGGTDAILGVITVTSSMRPSRVVPVGQALALRSQNPSGDGIAFTTPSVPGERASLKVLDVLGREVFSQSVPAGLPLAWRARGATGTRVAPGIYFYKARAGSQELSGRVVILK